MAGTCLLKLGQPGKADKTFRRAIEIAGNNRDNYAVLSTALGHQYKQDEAREVTSKFRARFPTHSLKARAPEAQVLVIGQWLSQ